MATQNNDLVNAEGLKRVTDILTAENAVYDSLANSGEHALQASDLESGVWNFSAKASNAARARTKYLIPVRAGMRIEYSNTTFDTFFGVLETPASTGYIAGNSGWKTNGIGTVSITADGWMTFVIRNHADNTAAVDPAEFNSVVIIRTDIGKSVGDLSGAMASIAERDLLASGRRRDGSDLGVTFAWNAAKTECTVNGANSGSVQAINSIFGSPSELREGLAAGKTYHVQVKTTDSNLRLGFYFYVDGSFSTSVIFTADGDMTIPAGTTGLIAVIGVPVGASVTNQKISDIALREKIAVDVSQYSADVPPLQSNLANLSNTAGIYESLANDGEYTIKSSDLEVGQWAYSTKSSTPASRARTKYLIPVRAGMKIAYANPTFDTFFGVLETPTSGSYKQVIGWKTDGSGTVDITTDGWMTFVIRNHADNTADVDPVDYDSVVTIKTKLRQLIDAMA